MNKIKKKFIIILSISIIILILSPNITAWDNCPFGYEDDPYPGKCWRYKDTNNDGICDLSQSKPTENKDDNEQKTNSTSINQTSNQNRENKSLLILIISFIIIFIFVLISKYLTKIKKLSNPKEKIIWNLLLLIFFLPSGITGIILVLMPTFSALREIGYNFIELHSITSFFFLWITGYHIIWHTKYYSKLF